LSHGEACSHEFFEFKVPQIDPPEQANYDYWVTPWLSPHCPAASGEYYSRMTDHQAAWSSWVWNPNLLQPGPSTWTMLPAHTWVEIIHQAYYMDGTATWMYPAAIIS